MPILAEVLGANEEYAATFGAKSELALPPARGFAILTCMDARLDPAKYAGLSEGDAHVIRNAGAPSQRRRHPIVRDLLQAARYSRVVRHSPLRLRDGVLHGQGYPETAELGPDGFRDVGSGPGSTEAKYVDWLTISNREQSVVEDVRRIRGHPLVPARIPIYGYIYDVRTGRLIEVSEATEAGRPS